MSLHVSKSWTPWRIFRTLLGAIVIVVVALIGWEYWLYEGGIFRTSSFNETKWKSLNRKTSDSTCYRGGMAHDIKTNILRTGLAKIEVENLLGKPDFSRGDVDEYFLGMCSGLRIDFDTLYLQFDSEGRLINVQIVQH